MPFVSKSQVRACFAKDDPNWDCKKWAKKTKDIKSLPDKKTENATLETIKMKTFSEFLEEKDPELVDEAKKEKWIQGAVKKPGSFTAYCGGKVTDACIEKGKHSDDPKTKKRAVLAQTFREKIPHKKK